MGGQYFRRIVNPARELLLRGEAVAAVPCGQKVMVKCITSDLKYNLMSDEIRGTHKFDDDDRVWITVLFEDNWGNHKTFAVRPENLIMSGDDHLQKPAPRQ